MNEEVKVCVDAKITFFDKYYIVPDKIKSEVETFINDVKNLGSSCNNAGIFEEKFISTGLSERFNTILPKCTPKKQKMTKESKKQSIKITKEILKNNKDEIIKDSVKKTGERIFNNVKDEAITKNRERMIEDGTYDDYAIASNNMNTAGTIFNFLKNKFGKK